MEDPMLRFRKRSSGFTLVELMIVVAIIGILAIPAFTKYIKRSKTAEAAGHLNKMWAGSVSYYEADHVDAAGASIPRQFPVSSTAAVGGPVECGCNPTGKCVAIAADWQAATWVNLSFSIPDPFLYRPKYTSAGINNASTFTAEAIGDLDCNGTLSNFKRLGAVDANGDVSGSKAAIVTNELE
jgi:prepilin-type N-terminal cleavage/methylation domain-containing protein